MTLSAPGLVGALLFLIAGLVELAVFQRAIYPRLSERHELRKVTQEQGQGPARLARVIRIQSLLVMPIVGYVFGHVFFAPSTGAT